MKEVINEEGMIHVLGDCYCDDWAFAEYYDKYNNNNNNNNENDDEDNEDRISRQHQKRKMESVAYLMLQQVQSGSIAIFHMPQYGFREGCYDAIQQFLIGIQKRGMKCISLSEMMEKKNTV